MKTVSTLLVLVSLLRLLPLLLFNSLRIYLLLQPRLLHEFLVLSSVLLLLLSMFLLFFFLLLLLLRGVSLDSCCRRRNDMKGNIANSKTPCRR